MKWFQRTRVVERVVDDRVFLLGLDELYRSAIKLHERGELLDAARSVTSALGVAPVSVPVEGYYAEDEQLTEYFLLMRSLGSVSGARVPEVETTAGYRRLVEVTSARLYGEPQWGGNILPAGRDALARALDSEWPSWHIETLTEAARVAAVQHDDISLVGLAARAGDPVVLTALRESVVLYAEVVAGAAPRPPRYVYAWRVDAALAEAAGRFIATFNGLFDEDLPPAVPDNAKAYWSAGQRSDIVGRCVRLGFDRSTPPRQYHWAIRRGEVVEEFWDTEIWTTERYRTSKLGFRRA